MFNYQLQHVTSGGEVKRFSWLPQMLRGCRGHLVLDAVIDTWITQVSLVVLFAENYTKLILIFTLKVRLRTFQSINL